MRRRAFITLLGGAAAAWPIAARAQQPAMPVIGYLSSQSASADAGRIAAMRQSLAEAGYAEGTNLAIEYRWAEGDYDRLAAQAAELVRRRIAVIFAASLPSALAAKAATTTIPIVFVMGADPVKLGVVPSLNRPGGNVTGVYQVYGALGGKRLELIRELVPKASLIAVLTNPKNPNSEDHLDDVRAAAHAMGQRILVFPVSADGTSSLLLRASRNKAPMRCSSPTIPSSAPGAINLSLRRIAGRCRRSITRASSPQTAG
jgi:putative tryptophan/tyrosine transport system substrate-binding protein